MTAVNNVCSTSLRRLDSSPLNDDSLVLLSETHKKEKDSDLDDNLDDLTNDSANVIAFTENAAGVGESEGQKKIKTLEAK